MAGENGNDGKGAEGANDSSNNGSGDGSNSGGQNGNQPGNKGTDSGKGGDNKPQTVPYDRFATVTQENANMKTELQKYKDAEAKRLEAERLATGKHEEVINELKPKAARAEKLDSTLATIVENEIKLLPEDRRSLVPKSLPIEDQLAYITENRAFLMGDKKANVNTVKTPKEGDVTTHTSDEIYTAEQIADPKFYEKNRDAILIARKEGRVKD